MAFPGRYIETGTLLGAWPVLPSAVAGTAIALPRTTRTRATIIGIKREPSAGFDVDNRSFILNVDGTNKIISFTYGGFLPLSEVLNQINADAGTTVAYNDNGFLRLQSPTSGAASYLKVQVDPASAPTNVLTNLGLFAEVESYSGELTTASHVDPDRQVAPPGQMAMAEGENFEARVFNRAIAQLGLNSDRNEGILSKKRLAVRDTYTVASYAKPGSIHGIQMSGGKLVYVGKTQSPTQAALLKLFAVLDSEGREFSKDVYVTILTGYTGTFSVTSDSYARQVMITSWAAGQTEATFEQGNYFFVSNAFTGAATVLNGKPLKILEIRASANEVILENVDPATGQHVPITGSNLSITLIRRDRLKVEVDGVYENQTTATAGSPRLEQTIVNKRTTITATRAELNNRVVCVGQNFLAAPAVAVGDVVVWGGSTIYSPFNNNGNYRVDKIIDKETLQLVAGDWGAAVLNPVTTGGAFGNLTIQTDGDFVLDPFLRFSSSTSSNAQPANGEALEVAFFNSTTFRQATIDNPAFFQSDVRFTQESDDSMARAITRLWGPSVTSVDGVLYNDYRINLESVHQRLNQEHYTFDEADKVGSYPAPVDIRSWGRHKDIRPDTVDMWNWTPPDLSTARVILRGTGRYSKSYNSGTSYTDRMDTLLKVQDYTGVTNLQINSMGSINNVQDQDIGLGLDNRVWMDMTFNNPRADSSGGGGLPTLGDYYISGERIIQRLKHRWYNATDTGANVTLTGQHLSTDLELTYGSSQIFTGIYGSRIEIGSTGLNQTWATTLKFLELKGSLGKGATNRSDNADAVWDFYGAHINYTLTTNFKIYNNHYGLKIEDITRAGTGWSGPVFPTVANYAIYTGKGQVRFGDAVSATGSWTALSDGDLGFAGKFAGTWSYTNALQMSGLVVSATGSYATGALPLATGISSTLTLNNLTSSTTLAVGADIEAYQYGTGTITSALYGARIRTQVGASSACPTVIGLGIPAALVNGIPSTYRAIKVFAQSSAVTGSTGGIEIETISGGTVNNYGLKIGNVSGNGNYSIFTGTGPNFFGDRVGATVSGSRNVLTNGIGLDFSITENATTPTGGSIGAWIDYNMANTNNTSFTAAALWVRMRRSNSFANTGAHSILRLSDGSYGTAQGTHYGLYIDTLSGGTTNYAIYAANGLVRFNGTLNMGSQLIQSILTPAALDDATPKRYVDGNNGASIGGATKIHNAIINGCGLFLQRYAYNATIALTNTPQYTFDRWRAWDTNVTPQSSVKRYTDNLRNAMQVQRTAASTNTGDIHYTQEIARSFLYNGLYQNGTSSEGMTLAFQVQGGSNFSPAGGLLRVRLIVNGGGTGATGAIGSGLTYASGSTSTILDVNINVGTSSRKWFTIPVPTLGSVTAMVLVFSMTPTGTAGASDFFTVSQVLLIPGDCVTTTTETTTVLGPVNCRYVPAGGSIAAELMWCERFYEKSYRLIDPPGTATTPRGWSTITTATSIANASAFELGAQPQYRVRKASAGMLSGDLCHPGDSPNINPTITVYTITGTANQFYIGGANRVCNAPVSAATEVGFEIYNNSGGAIVPAIGPAYGHWVADYEIV